MTALAGVGDEFAMRIDALHALKDIVDAYDTTSEMVVTEAIANAIDVGARTVRVTLDGEARSISFHNDGPAMNSSQFEDYHVIARSSKSKGSGIGFAGVGAKVYLAAWGKTVIRTETIDGRAPLASEMYVDGGTLKARYVKPSTRRRGTLYRVTLRPDDYSYLDKSAARLIAEVFGPAIEGGLRVYVNGDRVRPWMQGHEMRRKFAATAKGARLPVVLTVAKDDLAPDRQGLQYHVSGKVIATKKPDWMADIAPAHAGRVHAYVDATQISGHLNLSKTTFKPTGAVAAAYKETGRRVFEELRKAGYARDPGVERWERTSLTRFFDRLFRNPDFAFLDPGAGGRRGTGDGQGSGGAGEGGGGPGGRGGGGAGAEGDGGGGSGRGGRSLYIGFVPMPNDPREGWLDASGRMLVNTEHPLFRKYKSSAAARSQRVLTVVTIVLLKNAATKREMGAEEVLDLQSRVLAMAEDVW